MTMCMFLFDRNGKKTKQISYTSKYSAKLFDPKYVRKYNKSEFATKQRKMYLTTTVSQIGPPHRYRDNKYVTN